MYHLLVNQFHANGLFLYPLKTSENQMLFWCFQEVWNETRIMKCVKACSFNQLGYSCAIRKMTFHGVLQSWNPSSTWNSPTTWIRYWLSPQFTDFTIKKIWSCIFIFIFYLFKQSYTKDENRNKLYGAGAKHTLFSNSWASRCQESILRNNHFFILIK